MRNERIEQAMRACRPRLRLSEIERLIKKHRIIVPPLSRATLRNMCEDGTFDATDAYVNTVGWLVYEESFLEWVLKASRVN